MNRTDVLVGRGEKTQGQTHVRRECHVQTEAGIDMLHLQDQEAVPTKP